MPPFFGFSLPCPARTPLSQLSFGQQEHVWGVALEFGQSGKSSRGKDWYCRMRIADESMPDGITTMLFRGDSKYLPTPMHLGKIFRFSKITFLQWGSTGYAPKTQLTGNPFHETAIFDSDTDGDLRPIFQTPGDKGPYNETAIQQLREWYAAFQRDRAEHPTSSAPLQVSLPPPLSLPPFPLSSAPLPAPIPVPSTPLVLTPTPTASGPPSHGAPPLPPPPPPPPCIDDRPASIHRFKHVLPKKIAAIRTFQYPTYRFRTQARVTGYQPADIRDFTRPMCAGCDAVHFAPGHLGKSFTCTKCQLQVDSPKYCYVFQLLVEDDSGVLSLLAWKANAAQFFADLPPVNLYLNSQALQALQGKLAALIGRTLDCCLFSYHIDEDQNKRRYQLCETTLALISQDSEKLTDD